MRRELVAGPAGDLRALVGYPQGLLVRARAAPAGSALSRSIRMQRICERAYEVRLSAAVGQEPEVGLM